MEARAVAMATGGALIGRLRGHVTQLNHHGGLAAGARRWASGQQEERCRLLVVGGGAGGCAIAAYFARRLGRDQVTVVEPASQHYYQPLFTLVGAGERSLSEAARPMQRVLPKGARWLRDAAAEFRPAEDLVVTAAGRRLRYDCLVIACGLQLRYQDVRGLEDALALPGSGVGSNYSPLHVDKTWASLRALRSGRALFTFPNTAVKCAGAPQKILYLADDVLRRSGRRGAVRLEYHTALSDIFGVKHYAEALWPIAREKGVHVSLRSELVEVRGAERVAVFRDVDNPERVTQLDYAFLHVAPPQGPVDALRSCKDLADPKSGYLQVDKRSLQHVRFGNVWGVGDCTNAPTSKTAAAAAAQTAVVRQALDHALTGRRRGRSLGYDGYTSCPLVTARGRCVLAEFDYDGSPLETFPVDQRRERWSMYQLKATFMPWLYWHAMLTGRWGGPAFMRKILHLGIGR